jgi:hypothetical protein
MEGMSMARSEADKHLRRVRRICMTLPEVAERISHGEPTFFLGKRVFAMSANNHHRDGHVAVWIPAAPGLQEALIEEEPETYFRPPYVGSRGWVGIELARVSDEVLAAHIRKAWELIASNTSRTARRRSGGPSTWALGRQRRSVASSTKPGRGSSM